jgi:hypothetical protein
MEKILREKILTETTQAMVMRLITETKLLPVATLLQVTTL